ncbi:mechanosensitive ion channel protein MscS [Flavobacterium akiainvivens]|uniref:Mechanosensitive ion channel protein MscS n=1 Tax=Flavobacterium akiainvivens TaxID=1202724 RepID=A0A0M8MJV0_9FLAO|nr:mechanosensitive ion channel domain-containing protein [Flavobacterium akiainvivens]KOS07691.1 mechanosensitive ion channel protein MscS [Flavobacterium akiainvivens]SFQ24327.1 small conductance mechanosensitive channel [Flavobacterium akiainvivens]
MNEETKLEYYIGQFTDGLIGYVPNLIKAVLILLFGLVIIKIIRRVITGIVTKKPEHDPTLLKFILDVATWTLRGFIFVSIIGALGVDTATFAAAIAAAGLAIGLSLQGSLSNFAGGLLIIMFKPFRIGDFIEAQGQMGTVNSIQIFSTKLITPTNQVVYLPNGTLSNNTIKNFSQELLRRADILIGVGYNSNMEQVKNVIFSTIKNTELILQEPAPLIEVRNLGENSVDLMVMIWCERANYGKMVSEFYQNIKAGFDAAGIEIPFPQREINIKNNGNLLQ